jgi:hypothetical protein
VEERRQGVEQGEPGGRVLREPQADGDGPGADVAGAVDYAVRHRAGVGHGPDLWPADVDGLDEVAGRTVVQLEDGAVVGGEGDGHSRPARTAQEVRWRNAS